MNTSADPYIARLEADKKALEAQIADLQSDIRTINNLIYKRKSEAFADQQGERINLKNAERLFFETLILDAIRSRDKGLRTREIYTVIARAGYGINYNTLRSYVAKMRDKGLIKKATSESYYWVTA